MKDMRIRRSIEEGLIVAHKPPLNIHFKRGT